METPQPTPNLPGELYPDQAKYYENLQKQLIEEVGREQAEPEAILDPNNPWDHIWISETEGDSELQRAATANLEGYKYFLGFRGMVNLITEVPPSLSWLPVFRLSWLKDRKDIPTPLIPNET